mgnify:CR=1 FL=1
MICEKIDILSAEIETCLNQIRELKDKKQCPKCFNEIDLESKFCSHCGEKQEQEEAKEVEVVETINNEEAVSNETVIVENQTTSEESEIVEDNN